MRRLTIYRTSCRACGKISYGKTQKDANRKHKTHVDNECKILRFWVKANKILGRELTHKEVLKLLGIPC